MKTTPLMTILLLGTLCYGATNTHIIPVESMRLVNIHGLNQSPNPIWLESDESHGVAFLQFPSDESRPAQATALELRLKSADLADAQSQSGFAVMAAGHLLGQVTEVTRNQSITIPLDANALDLQNELNLILVPGGPDGVCLLPKAELVIHSAPTIQLGQNLVAAYGFDGHYQNVSGQAHHGTPKGNCSLTENRLGQADKALQLNGCKDTQITIPHSDALTPQHLTLSLWVKGNQPKLWARMIHKFNHRQKKGYALFYNYQNKALAFEAFGRNGTYLGLASQSKLQPHWQHLVVTYDGSHARLYYNGKEEISVAKAIHIEHTTSDLIIGNGYDGNHHFPWSGAIDEVRIYNRALSELEVQALYQATPDTPKALPDLKDVDVF